MRRLTNRQRAVNCSATDSQVIYTYDGQEELDNDERRRQQCMPS